MGKKTEFTGHQMSQPNLCRLNVDPDVHRQQCVEKSEVGTISPQGGTYLFQTAFESCRI